MIEQPSLQIPRPRSGKLLFQTSRKTSVDRSLMTFTESAGKVACVNHKSSLIPIEISERITGYCIFHRYRAVITWSFTLKDSQQHLKELTFFPPMLLRTRAPTPSDCSTLKTVFSTLLTFILRNAFTGKNAKPLKHLLIFIIQ